jgi:hygromycin-B 7''-O-kinase
MPKDIYLQPDAADDVWEPEMVLSLVRRHVPSAMNVSAIDESGGEARAYAVDSNIILKTQRPNRLRPRTNLAKEVFFLNQLAAGLPEISVPRVLGYGHDGPLIEYVVLTRMPGVALIQANLAPAERVRVMCELGQMLRHIHSLPQKPFADNALFPGDRGAADVRQRVAEQLKDLVTRILSEKRPWPLRASPAEVAMRTLALLPHCDNCVALHSNPWHEHTFVDPSTHRYSGLIDFGDAYISHPAFDLRRWRIRAERDALMEGYTADAPVNDGFQTTWIVAQVLGDMGAIASSPAFAEEAGWDLEDLLRKL